MVQRNWRDLSGFPQIVRGDRLYHALIGRGRRLAQHALSRVAGLSRRLRVLSPIVSRYLVWARDRASTVLMLLGLVVQMVFLVLLWELVDLAIALMELWVELAAKHLEIVLDR